jgi:hypothetical protein
LVSLTQTEIGPLWTICGMVANSTQQIGTRCVDTATLLADHACHKEAQTPLEWEIDSQTDRVIQCLRVLVCNLLLLMSDPDHAPIPIGKHRPGWTRGPAPAGAPTHRMFQVGRPVTIDVRREVTEYCRGGRRSTPTVASLVRGHYRHVAHGPRKSLRRLQWHEPHWRNGEQAVVTSPRVKVGD